ncbi:hypothetical protein ABZS96_26750 [Streptomyces avermitilis]|uniref:hypothetical protein n=1 Tax=Streptomyces avermitilis TaxID=33903 RepID=UPI0033BDA89A
MQSTIAAMYPRMRTGTFFTPTTEGDGVLLTHGSEVVTFQGTSTYAWLERLSPHLTGRHSVQELTASLPEPKRQMIERLIGALHEAGFVRDVGLDEPHSLSARELESYASEIAFIEAFRDSPTLRFQRFRRARILAVGSGSVFAALVEGGLLSGLERLSARLTSSEAAQRARLEQLAEGARTADPGQRLETGTAAADDPAGLWQAVGGADVVLYAADISDPVLLGALDRACAELGRTLIPVTLRADEAWVGPVCAGPRPKVRWESLWRRLCDPALGEPGPHRFLTGPVPGIVANHLVFRAFAYLTGVADDSASSDVVRIDLETLQTSAHTLTPHPLLSPAPARRDTAAGPQDAGPAGDLAHEEAVDAEELAERVGSLTDGRLGVLGPVAEEHFEQFPLRVVRLSVADPHRPGVPFAVWGAGRDFPQARDAALRHGLAAYAVRYADPRRIDGGRVTGFSLADGTAVPVPAAEVFTQPEDSAAAGRLPAGTAAGPTWAAAVEQALLDHCLRRAGSAPAGEPVALDRLELPDTARRFLDLLDTSGQETTAHRLDALSGSHAYALRLGTGPAEFGAGLTASEAVESGLARLLLAHQSRGARQPEYAPSSAVSPAPPSAGAAAGGVRHRPLVAALRASGLNPVVVPLDHDPAVHSVLPYVVRVVLLDA